MLALAPLSWRTVSLAAGLGVFALAAPAMATQFTWNPSAAVAGADGQFTATNITVQDYAGINVSPSGSFTENGLINLSNFSNNGTPVTLPNLDNTYALYASFTAAGTQSSGTVAPAPGATIDGTFNSLSYSLFAATGKPTFGATTAGGTVGGLTNSILLATGSLISGTTALTNDPTGGLSATATTVNTLNVVDPAFFVSPASTFTLGLNVAFTNTGSVLSAPSSSSLVIDGGGGNATLNATTPPPPVPEPASFAVLGAGLLGLAMARRQRLI